jgi:hypothetical protein
MEILRKRECTECAAEFETIFLYRYICFQCQPLPVTAEWIATYKHCLDCGKEVRDADGKTTESGVQGRFGDRHGSMCMPCYKAGDYQAKANAEVREKLIAEGKLGDGIDDYENWRGMQKDADEYYFCKANDCLSDWRS